jgi:hypothetical protein
MAPKVNAAKGKSINIISKQTNRSLHIATPLMMTWGISDFVNEEGESDGKFSISLNFPNDEYRKPSTDDFLQKMKDLENQILDDAVRNCQLWWGESMSREVCKHTFFPFLKYSKNKDTKKIDLTKPPSIRAKVPFYDGRWGVEIYDTKMTKVFPSDSSPDLSPADFVQKLSQVACVLQCGGIWIGGKGWGLTWKLIQCVVKPREVVSVYGKCHIQLSEEDRGAIESQKIQDDSDETTLTIEEPVSTEVADSDGEDEPAPVVEQEPAPAPVAKKVVKKAAPVSEEPVLSIATEPATATAAATATATAPVAKKVVKKVAPK